MLRTSHLKKQNPVVISDQSRLISVNCVSYFKQIPHLSCEQNGRISGQEKFHVTQILHCFLEGIALPCGNFSCLTPEYWQSAATQLQLYS